MKQSLLIAVSFFIQSNAFGYIRLIHSVQATLDTLRAENDFVIYSNCDTETDVCTEVFRKPYQDYLDSLNLNCGGYRRTPKGLTIAREAMATAEEDGDQSVVDALTPIVANLEAVLEIGRRISDESPGRPVLNTSELYRRLLLPIGMFSWRDPATGIDFFMGSGSFSFQESKQYCDQRQKMKWKVPSGLFQASSDFPDYLELTDLGKRMLDAESAISKVLSEHTALNPGGFFAHQSSAVGCNMFFL